MQVFTVDSAGDRFSQTGLSKLNNLSISPVGRILKRFSLQICRAGDGQPKGWSQHPKDKLKSERKAIARACGLLQ